MNDLPIIKPEIMETSALESLERASIDMQISTAKRYPRQLSEVKKSMLSFATLDVETAESCFYVLQRDNKQIDGPSVRLAEIAASCYTNLRSGARIIGNDGKMLTAQGVCHDLENNVLFSVEVRRRITKKDGSKFSDDMQVVTGNAACSIALRNAIFKAVPSALIKPVYDQVRKVAVGDQKTLSERRTKCLDSFSKMGVNKEKVFAFIGKSGVEEIDLSDIEKLIGVHTAIKDGDTTIDETFPEAVQVKKPFQKEEAKTEAPKKTEEGINIIVDMVKDAGIDSLAFESFLRSKGVISSMMTLSGLASASTNAILDSFDSLVKEFKEKKKGA